MKKMVSLLLTLCVFLSSAVFAFAEDKRDQPFEQRPYEVFPRRDVLYVDVDTAATDPDELIADLKQSGFVEDVISSGSSFAYPGEQEPGTAYLSVAVSAPCEENNAAVRELLANVPGVRGVYQPVWSLLAVGDDTWSDLTKIIVTVDRRRFETDAAAADLRAVPHVHSVERLTEAEDGPYDLFALCVEYPVEENCWLVIDRLKHEACVEYIRIETLRGEKRDQFMTENGPLLAANAGYEVIHHWNWLYVDYDAAKCDAAQLTDAITRSGLAVQVQPQVDIYIYGGEEPDGSSLLVYVRAPYRENNEKLQRLLGSFEGICSFSHLATGERRGDDFTFTSILTCIDLTLCDIQTALRELRALPHVRGVYNMHADDDDFPMASFAIEVEEPSYENGPEVLWAVNRKEYVAYAQFDPLALLSPESEEITFPYGDVNCDGKVSADDARQILRFSVRLDKPGNYLAEVLADMDNSGSVTAADARLALRTAVGLNPKNYYTYSEPKYAGLIAGKSVELTKQGDKLLITASTTGSNQVTKCGFRYIKLQKLVNGVWTDMKEYAYRDQFNNTNSKVFSISVSVPKGNIYRVVCEHYSEAPYLQLFTQSASYYNTTNAITM